MSHTAVLCGLRYDVEKKEVEKALNALKVMPHLITASGVSQLKSDKSDASPHDMRRYLVFLNCNSPDAAREIVGKLHMTKVEDLGIER